MKPTELVFLVLSLLAIFNYADGNIVRLPIQRQTKSRKDGSSRRLQQSNGTHADDLIDVEDGVYMINVNIGSNNETFRLQLDTGSDVLYVPSNTVNKTQVPRNIVYDCSASTTCKLNKTSVVKITYGDGSVSGYEMIDQIKIGDLTIPKFNMLLVEEVDDSPLDESDGLIGVGFSVSKPEYTSMLDALKAQKLIDHRVFSIYMSNSGYSDTPSIGELIIGGYDPNYVDGEFSYLNALTDDGTGSPPVWWTAFMDSVKFGDRSFTNNGYYYSVIFDTGTSITTVPSNVLNYVANYMNERSNCQQSGGFVVCDCVSTSTLPTLSFNFGTNMTFSIPPDAYFVPNDGYCMINLMVEDGDGPDFILGDNFLKYYYIMYSKDNSTIGIANLKGQNYTTITSSIKWWVILLIVAGGLLLVTTIIVAITLTVTHNKRKRAAQNQPQGQQQAYPQSYPQGYPPGYQQNGAPTVVVFAK